MDMIEEEFGDHVVSELNEIILGAVNDDENTGKIGLTYKRLMAEGYSKEKTMELVRDALAMCLYDICFSHKDCDEQPGDSLTVNLNNLPAEPEKLASAYDTVNP